MEENDNVFEALDKLFAIRQKYHRNWYFTCSAAAAIGALNGFVLNNAWWAVLGLSLLTFVISTFWNYRQVNINVEEWMDYCEENSIEIFEAED